MSTTIPDDAVEEAVDPRTLAAHPRNYRAHPPAQQTEIRASLRMHGVVKPVVARKSDGLIVAGHGVVEAAVAEGLATIPVWWWECTDAQAKRFLVADNEISRMASDDNAELAQLLADIKIDVDPTLAGTGWDVGGLDEFIRTIEAEALTAQNGDDEKYTVPRKGKSTPGIYDLGPHRLVYDVDGGRLAMEAALGGGRADVVASESFAPKWTDEFGSVTTDMVRAAIPLTKPGGAWWIVLPGGPASLDLMTALHAAGVWRQTLVWTQQGGSRHRTMLYGWRPGASHRWHSDRRQTSVIEHGLAKSGATWLATSTLFYALLRHNATRSDVVLDPSAGFGSTLIASSMIGARWAGVVRSAICADVIRSRWGAWAALNGLDAGSGAIGK